MKGSKIHYPQIRHCRILIILAVGSQKVGKARRGFRCATLIRLQTDLPKELRCYRFPSPGSLVSRARLTPTTGKETKSWHTVRQTLLQTVIPSICSPKGSFSFPKNHLFSPKRPSLSPLKWCVVLNEARLSHFSMGLSHVRTRCTC